MPSVRYLTTIAVVTQPVVITARYGLMALTSTTNHHDKSFLTRLVNRLFKPFNELRDYEWRRVPPPNWACKRGGLDYW